MIATALKLAARGLAVLPCKNIPGDPNHKAPWVFRGFKDASTDDSIIRAWWTHWPNALVGVVAEKFCALDVDLQHAEAAAWLGQHHDQIPITRTHRTQRGGLHFLFCPHPGIGCSVGTLAPHIDTRGQGKGYIVWWP